MSLAAELQQLSSPVPLRRSARAAAAERWAQSESTVGACQDWQPVLDGMTRPMCSRVFCMWSPRLAAPVDMYFRALTLHNSTPPAPPDLCAPPTGGQLPNPPATVPKLAFIITVHNSPTMAAQCLLQVFLAAAEAPSAEILVIDDGSSQNMAPLRESLRRLRVLFGTDARYLTNPTPLGFGAANDVGIAATAAEYVMLVNSDAFLLRGTTYALLETFRHNINAGLVGPLFIGPRNVVAEAGGIVYADGSPANYARGRALESAHNYMRPVDYMSAACVVFPRQLYIDVGGFDSGFGQGYFEDTDLAMSIWYKGRSVLYQPLAVVYHSEGSTLGTDASPDKQNLMRVNRRRFVDKWRGELRLMCGVETEQDTAAARAMSPKLLWVDDIVPEGDHDSGSVRTAHMLQVLVENGYYVAYQPTAGGREPRYRQQARLQGVHILTASPAGFWQLRRGNRCRYDAIVVARRYVFDPVKDIIKVACPSTPIIYDTVDLHFLREARMALTEPAQSTPPVNSTQAVQSDDSFAPSMQPARSNQASSSGGWNFSALNQEQIVRWIASGSKEAKAVKANMDTELALVDRSRVTIVVSEVERAVLQHYRPHANVHVVSNIHDVSNTHPRCRGRSGILFVGNFNHIPNRQAVTHLLLDILPLARSLLSTRTSSPPPLSPPDLASEIPPPASDPPAPVSQPEDDHMTLHIVGANIVAEDVRKLIEGTPGVQLHGYLTEPELKLLYNSIKVVVAPLMSGAGVKGKVNQAMKYGVPVVATPIAVEAMSAVDGESCMVGRTPEEFARKLVEVYTSCDLWDRLSAGGITNVIRFFSLQSAYDRILQAFVSAGVPPVHRMVRSDCRD